MSNDRTASGLVEPQGLGEEPLFYFTRVYLLFMQGLFKQLPEGSYRWSDDDALTEIAITDQVPIPRDNIEQRPHVVTMRGPAQFANLTLDQMQSLNLRTGEKRRTDLVACTMSVNCIAKNGIEAQRIAWIVARHLRGLKILLQRAGFHKIGDEVSIGPESPPGAMVAGDSEPDWVMVTVHSPFFFQWTDIDAPLDAIALRSVETHMHTVLAPASSTSTAGAQELRALLSPPTIRGRVIGPAPADDRAPIDQTAKT